MITITRLAKSYPIGLIVSRRINNYRWCAPEVLKFGKYSVHSDCWSFAVVCWEIFSFGEIPYRELGSNNVDVANQVSAGYRLTFPASCPANVQSVFKKCWVEKPSQRPAFSEIVLELENIIREMAPSFTDNSSESLIVQPLETFPTAAVVETN